MVDIMLIVTDFLNNKLSRSIGETDQINLYLYKNLCMYILCSLWTTKRLDRFSLNFQAIFKLAQLGDPVKFGRDRINSFFSFILAKPRRVASVDKIRNKEIRRRIKNTDIA